MIKYKKKLCKSCLQPKYIWSYGRCKQCAFLTSDVKKVKKNTTPIAKMSGKRKKEMAQYLKLRLDYLDENKTCQIRLLGCKGGATDIHHTYSGKDRASHYLDTETWLSACRHCHDWIHNFSKQARELGLLK